MMQKPNPVVTKNGIERYLKKRRANTGNSRPSNVGTPEGPTRTTVN